MEHFSRRDDVTLANPLGPPRLGRAEVERTIEETAANFVDGSMRFEEVSRYTTPDLGYVVWLERGEVQLIGSEDMSPSSLRVTMIFRRRRCLEGRAPPRRPNHDRSANRHNHRNVEVFRNPDHVTIEVADAAKATKFFELLGFQKQHVALIDGGAPATYMGMPDMKAQHITLALEGSVPPFQIQLLEFDPAPAEDPGEHPTNRRRRGFNHLAFRVDDITPPPPIWRPTGCRC